MISLPTGRRNTLLRLVWAAAVVTVVVGSLLPGDSGPMRTLDILQINDKIEHGLSYAFLALLPVLHENRRNALLLPVMMVVMGVLLEFGQLYSPGRTFDTHDMLADFIGVVIGALIGLCFRPFVR